MKGLESKRFIKLLMSMLIGIMKMASEVGGERGGRARVFGGSKKGVLSRALWLSRVERSYRVERTSIAERC